LTWFRREPEVHWIAGFGDQPETLRVAAELVENRVFSKKSVLFMQESGAGSF